MKLIEIFDFHCFRLSYCFAELGDKCFSDLCCLDLNILNSCGFAGAILWSFAGNLWCFEIFPLADLENVNIVEDNIIRVLNAVEAGGYIDSRDCENSGVELCKRMRRIVQVPMCGGHRDTAGVSSGDSLIRGCPRGAYCCLKVFNFSRVLGELLGAHFPRGPILEPLGLLEFIEVFWRNLCIRLPLGSPEISGTPGIRETLVNLCTFEYVLSFKLFEFSKLFSSNLRRLVARNDCCDSCLAIRIDNVILLRNPLAFTGALAILYTLFWIRIACCFCGRMYRHDGESQTYVRMSKCMRGWMLSFDNLFVFHLIFSVYGTPDTLNHHSLLCEQQN